MASNYFSSIPKLSYTLNDYVTEEIVTDIVRRVKLEKEFKNNSAFFETYDVLDGERPEDVSFRFYGTPSLHWLILLVNNIIDPRFEWPQLDNQVYEQTEKKYGGPESVFARNRAFNSDGYRVETFFLLTEDSSHKNPIRLSYETSEENGIPTKQPIAYQLSDAIATFDTNYDVESKKNESYRNIQIIKSEIVDELVRNYKILINK